MELRQGGRTVAEVPLSYAGSASTFRGELPLAEVRLEPGFFEVVLLAQRASEANTGSDRITVGFSGGLLGVTR